MPACPYCGAENPEGSGFCSLCLTRLGAWLEGGTPSSARPTPPGVSEKSRRESIVPADYVSPGDYRAVAREMGERGASAAKTGASSYRSGAMDARAVSAAGIPSWAKSRSAGDIVLLVLKHSLLVFFALVAFSFFIGFFIVGAAFSGSESGIYIGLGITYAAEAFLIIWGGYRISMEAMERNKGWLYGVACVAAVVFFWQPLFAFILSLFLTGRAILPQTFSLVGILVVVFLLLPLGALGGWLAERRYLG